MMINEVLNFGIRIDSEGEPYRAEEPIENYISKTHEALNVFLESEKTLLRIKKLVNAAWEKEEASYSLKAADSLINVHPFFLCQQERISYINRSLAGKVLEIDPADTEKFKKTAIIPAGSDSSPEYWKYFMAGDRGNIGSLLMTRGNAEMKVRLLLDDTEEGLSKIPMHARSSLYGLLCGDLHGIPRIMEMSAEFSLPVCERISAASAAMQFDSGYSDKITKGIAKLATSGERIKEVEDLLDASEDSPVSPAKIEYRIYCLEDLIDLEIYKMLTGGIRLKRCISCGRYFHVTPDNDKYCSIPDKTGNTCLAAARKKELKKNVSDIYSTAYKTHFARVRRGAETEEEMNDFKETAKALRGEIYLGKLSLEEYKKKITGKTL